MSSKKNSQAMWGGRFQQTPDQLLNQINISLDVDKRLYFQDVTASSAHVHMLMQQNILSQSEGKDILSGLETILQELETGTFPFDETLEDIHMNIESRLTRLIGENGKKVHTARSRNDQVATDFRLWVKQAILDIKTQTCLLQQSLCQKAETYATNPFPGFTHLQIAQPVSFGHHLMAYVAMLSRDEQRLAACLAHMDECPLGAAAMGGTSFPIDPDYTAKALGFAKAFENSMDIVSDRDFVVEFLFCLSLISVHLSRFAEELIIWCSQGYQLVSLSDAWTTGSSIMPQKRNPDAAELVRGKTGEVCGKLSHMLMLLKGLPLTYNKDLQDDKKATFEAYDTVKLTLMCMKGMVDDLVLNVHAAEQFASQGYATATELADYCVRVLGLSFRDAHHLTGSIVHYASKKGLQLSQIGLEELQTFHAGFEKNVMLCLDVHHSLQQKSHPGSTNPKHVLARINAYKQKFGIS